MPPQREKNKNWVFQILQMKKKNPDAGNGGKTKTQSCEYQRFNKKVANKNVKKDEV